VAVVVVAVVVADVVDVLSVPDVPDVLVGELAGDVVLVVLAAVVGSPAEPSPRPVASKEQASSVANARVVRRGSMRAPARGRQSRTHAVR